MTNLDEIELRKTYNHNELKDIVCKSLESQDIDYEREKTVAPGARVDVFYDGIALEIKSDLAQTIDQEQLDKYEGAECVDQVALVLPEEWADNVRDSLDRPVIGVERSTVKL